MRSISNFATMSASEMQQIEGGTYCVPVKPVYCAPPPVVVCPPVYVAPKPVCPSPKPSNSGNCGSNSHSSHHSGSKGKGKC